MQRARRDEGESPQVEGKRPRSRSSIGRLLGTVVLGTALLSASCSDERDERTVGIYTLAITDKTPSAIDAVGDVEPLYQVTTQVSFPLRETPPSGGRVNPYRGGVWFTSKELQVQLTYVITNLGKQNVVVELLVDGWNEFNRYKPTVAVVENDGEAELEADRSMVDRLIIVPALGRVEGRVSFDDFERMATALAILSWEGKPHPNPFHVVEPHTKLQTDISTKDWIPPTIDGLTGFDLSLRARGQVNVVLEATLELNDDTTAGEHLAPKNELPPRRRPPRDYVPVVATPPP